MQVILDGIERHVAEARLGLDADDGRVDFTVAVAVLAVGLGVVAGRWGGRGLRHGRPSSWGGWEAEGGAT